MLDVGFRHRLSAIRYLPSAIRHRLFVHYINPQPRRSFSAAVDQQPAIRQLQNIGVAKLFDALAAFVVEVYPSGRRELVAIIRFQNQEVVAQERGVNKNFVLNLNHGRVVSAFKLRVKILPKVLELREGDYTPAAFNTRRARSVTHLLALPLSGFVQIFALSVCRCRQRPSGSRLERIKSMAFLSRGSVA